jgi:MFS family permease
MPPTPELAVVQDAPMHSDPPPQRDFWFFFAGQTVSALGNAVTLFAVPLVIYRLTGSALDLGIASATAFLPYLLFGLVIGAWVDRVDRKRLMVWTDLARAAVLLTIPALAAVDRLAVGWIYVAGFLSSTLAIAFDAAQFAAIPNLVRTDDLITANGRIQASYSAAQIVGPLLAGAFVALTPLTAVFAVDAASFVLSAISLLLIRRSFNVESQHAGSTGIRADIGQGLRYVLGHPLLRQLSIMMALVNFVGASYYAQLVLFAQERLDASSTEIGLLYAADAAGVVAISLMAGRLRRRWSFGAVALGALMIDGLCRLIFAGMTDLWLALPFWALAGGFGILFNINSGSLRQTIVPNHLLGRVISVAGVLAWSAIPLGSLLGGYLIERTGRVELVYAGIGLGTIAIAAAFALGPLGHSADYLEREESGIGD